jgi:hypothetical protein
MPEPDTYRVLLCVNCGHPGGQHIRNGGCRLCPECPAWLPGLMGTWSDARTRELEAKRA